MNESTFTGRLLRAILVLAVALSFLPYSQAAAQPSGAADSPGRNLPKQSRSAEKPSSPGLESSLSQLAETAEAEGQKGARDFGKQRDLKTDGKKVTVVVESRPGGAAAAKSRVEARGGRVEASYKGRSRVTIPVTQLEALAREDSVLRVRRPRQFVAEQTSQGVAETNAQLLQQLGYTGTGIKVGIIDLGFAGLDGKLGTELPQTVTKWTTEGDGDEGHGTAVAEIVHDMAPGAEIYVAQLVDDVDLGLATDWMLAQGVTVINMSLVVPGGGAGDGTGEMNAIIDDAVANGVFWANSAGNHRENHWSGNFVDADGDDNLEIAPGVEVQRFYAYAGHPIVGRLVWDDSWEAASQDYDLVLIYYNSATGEWEFEDASENWQAGNPGETPEEELALTAPQSGWYGWVISRYEATRSDVDFDLFDIYRPLENKVTARSLTVPADNRSDGFMAVGAVGRAPGFAQESYSSEGPTRDMRVAPEIAAPASVANSVYGTFGGTSASSPHVAGAAALVRQMDSGSTPAAVEQSIETSAVDLGIPGADNKYGHGRLWLPTAAGAMTSSPINGSLSGTVPGKEHRIVLNKGDDLSLTVTRVAGDAPLKVTLLSPTGGLLGTAGEGVALKRTATATGAYSVLVTKADADSNEAQYQLAWTRIKATSLAVAPTSVNPAFGTATVVKASLKDSGGAGVAGSVVFQRSYDKASWSTYKTVTTSGSTGAGSFSYTPSRLTYFRAVYSGAANYRPAASTIVKVNPKAYLTKPKAPSRVERKSTFTVSGYLKPKHATGTKHVKLKCERLEGGKWVPRESFSAKVSRYDSTTAKYSARVALPYAGKWRIRAVVAEDASHATTYSSYRSVVVNRTTLSMSSNRSTVTYGISAKLRGVLKDRDGEPLSGKYVVLEKSTDAKTWKKVKTLKTSSKGVVSKSVRPDKKTYYRFRYGGSKAQAPSTSAVKRIKPRSIVLTGDGNADKRVYLEKGKAFVYWTYSGSRMSLSLKHEKTGTTELKWSRSSGAGDNIFYATPTLERSGYYTIRVRTDKQWGVGIR